MVESRILIVALMADLKYSWLESCGASPSNTDRQLLRALARVSAEVQRREDGLWTKTWRSKGETV